ncbi:chaplin [Peterkaempfera bronchialis]|uniref:Chaplin n=1 Tax=Peterkaempfera bronchialis TaxID=2126346 RepID=A0A345SYZ6_9ACTN|nr:chaplin [Peterkaempfera bronchialis]AXI78951.1 chaplin [Peterkaempfera bronchialis]
MNAPKKVAAVSLAAAGLIAAGAGSAMASAGAEGAAVGSPGVISGNAVQVPVHVPVNLCGNTVNILIAAVNPAFGNTCINAG